mgnify:FL=1
MQGKKDLEAVESASSDDGDSETEFLNRVNMPVKDVMDGDEDLDSDDEKQKYDAELDDYLERAYQKYRKTTDGSTKRRKRARLANADKDLWQVCDRGSV